MQNLNIGQQKIVLIFKGARETVCMYFVSPNINGITKHPFNAIKVFGQVKSIGDQVTAFIQSREKRPGNYTWIWVDLKD